jgi:DNA-binding NtrC family response regulator
MRTQVLVAIGDPALRRLVLSCLAREQRFAVTASMVAPDMDAPIAGAQILIVEHFWRDSAKCLALIRRWRADNARFPVIMIAADSSEETAIDALRSGASDYLRLPLCAEELVASVDRLCPSLPGVSPVTPIGHSEAMRELREKIQRAAATRSNVLITGETGTGKELTAQAIHSQGSRRDNAFICVNCAAIPDGLLESELFGYERGAFTGANSSQDGKVKLAGGGTLVLDEIGEMSLSAQAKILRMIDTREIWPLGARTSRQVDARIVAATNRELEPLVRSGAFRSDLFYRLNVVRIRLTPLRERIADIPILLDQFVREFKGRFGRGLECFADDALAALLRYDWPGNVRELKNLVEFVFVNASGLRVGLADLPSNIREFTTPQARAVERELLLETLCATNWNVSQAARRLHWSRMTIYRKMAKYDMVKVPAAKAAAAH